MNQPIIRDDNIYSRVGHGPSPFRKDLYMCRLTVWGFGSEEDAYISMATLSNSLAGVFEDHEAVPDDWEAITQGEDLRLHRVPHQPKSDMRYPGFTILSEGHPTVEAAEQRKEEIMQEMHELTGAEFMAHN